MPAGSDIAGNARGLLIGTAVLAPLLVLGSIWWPVIDHYRRPIAAIDTGTVRALRTSPEPAILDELSRHRLLEHKAHPADAEVIAVADGILAGRLMLPGHAPVMIGLPFAERDLSQDSGRLQLRLASLIVPDFLLEAYRLTGDEAYFARARETIFAWQRFERRARLPRGAMWDRNAIAARAFVLSRFWSLWRHREDFSAAEGVAFFESVARDAALLRKDDHFGYRNNQGIVQNVALLHLAVAFPGLPDADAYQRKAVTRLTEQLRYHVTDEGVLQEHSAGYHAKFMPVLALAFRYLTLLEVPIPNAWRERYASGSRFYAFLKRPDGTLPMVGDTENRPYPARMATRFEASGEATPLTRRADARPDSGEGLWPLSGYAIWWQGLADWPHGENLSQTVIAWPNFVGRAHKHADDPSVLYWTSAGTWWTNVGYLSPGGKPLMASARSWGGSNAPHSPGTGAGEPRVNRIRFHDRSDNLAVIDLEREHANGTSARRQVVRYGDELVLVLDRHVDGAGRDSRQVWTVPHDVAIQPSLAGGRFRLTRQDGSFLPVLVAGEDGLVVAGARGQFEPYAGWIVAENRALVPTDALTFTARSGNWTIVAWAAHPGSSEAFTGPADMARWTGPHDWRLHLELDGRRLTIDRQDDVLTAVGGRTGAARLALVPGLDVRAQAQSLNERFAEAERRYAHARGHLPYRRRMSMLIAIAFLAQAVLVGAYLRLRPASRARVTVATLIAAVWAALAGWLSLVYFAA